MPVKIFIGNLDEYADEAKLRDLFEQFGKVSECDILTKFGFVHMPDEDEAKAAIAALHRTEFEGTRINVELSKGDGRGGRSGGGRGGRGDSRGMRGGRGRGGDRGSRYEPYGRPLSPPRRDPYRDPYYERDPYRRYPPMPDRDPYGRYPPPPERDPYYRMRDPYARDPYARDPRDPPYPPRDPYARPPPEYYGDARRSPDPYYDRYYGRPGDEMRSRYPPPPEAVADRKPATDAPFDPYARKDPTLNANPSGANGYGSGAPAQAGRQFGGAPSGSASQGYPSAAMNTSMGGFRSTTGSAQSNGSYRSPMGSNMGGNMGGGSTMGSFGGQQANMGSARDNYY